MTTKEKAQYVQEIKDTARAMLEGRQSFIEGSRRINELSPKAGMHDDPDIVPILAVASETDDLPMGDVQQLWQAAALNDLRPKIEQAETWAREVVSIHCRNLIQRFGNTGT